jgi:hypothetical protein
MTVKLGHDHVSAGELRQPTRNGDVLIYKVPTRGYEFGVINQAIPNSALVSYQIVAKEQIHLALGLELGQIEDIVVGLSYGLRSNVREVYLLLHIDLRWGGLGLGIFVRHEEACRLHS